MELGIFRVAQPCSGEAGTKIEHFVPFRRRAKPGTGIDFVAKTLNNCEAIAVEYVDKNGFVLSIITTAAAGLYTIEIAWEANVGAEHGNGSVTEKMKDEIKLAKAIIEEVSK